MSYGIKDYGSMMGDSVRMNAYVEALRNSVNGESVVLDLGAGTGIFSMLACRFGARKTYAIEPNDAIYMATQLAKDNGFAERIEFIQEISTRVELPEKVDIIISDLRGVLPIYSQHIPSIADARRRFLKPGGLLLPRKDLLWVAVVETPEEYQRYTAPWKGNHFNLNLEATQKTLTNSWGFAHIKPHQLMTDPKLWATLDYWHVDDPNVNGEVDFQANRNGIGHGLFVWFDATISEGISFSGGPGAPKSMVYGNGFFPFSKPIDFAKGDRISIKMQTSLVVENYVWRWKTNAYDGNSPQRCKANFDQSTFFGEAFSPNTIKKRANTYIPSLNEEGCIKKSILEQMARHIELGKIADRILEEFPHRFTKREESLAYVGELSQRYSK